MQEMRTDVLPKRTYKSQVRRHGKAGSGMNEDDSLNAARGILIGMAMSAAFWGTLGLIVWMVRL